MAGQLLVPQQYSTISIALAEAEEGDVIAIDPTVTYYNVQLNKRVHIISQDISQLATIRNDSSSYALRISSAVVGEVYLQGIYLLNSVGGSSAYAPIVSESSSVSLVCNRCSIAGVEHVTVGPISVVFRNCLVNTSFDNAYAVDYNEVQWSFFNCVIPDGPLDSLSYVVYEDSVTTTQAEYGYGYEYGYDYIDQLLASAYILSGTVSFLDITPEETQINLYRAVTGGIEAGRWASTNPDTTSGAWEFKYLPTNYSYYVSIVPPAGYEPKLLGPYTPVQE